jgi:hypothetical protein
VLSTVNFKACRFLEVLYLLVVRVCKAPINAFTNTNPYLVAKHVTLRIDARGSMKEDLIYKYSEASGMRRRVV